MLVGNSGRPTDSSRRLLVGDGIDELVVCCLCCLLLSTMVSITAVSTTVSVVMLVSGGMGLYSVEKCLCRCCCRLVSIVVVVDWCWLLLEFQIKIGAVLV